MILQKINFLAVGPLGIWMEHDYNNIQDREGLFEFMYKWLNDMEETMNPRRRNAIASIIVPLYSILTGTSYQTKKFQEL